MANAGTSRTFIKQVDQTYAPSLHGKYRLFLQKILLRVTKNINVAILAG